MTARHPCACCGYRTVSEPGAFEVCPVCSWEDDPSQSRDARLQGGANSPSLRDARISFNRLGACDEQARAAVRPPNPDELPRHRWPA